MQKVGMSQRICGKNYLLYHDATPLQWLKQRRCPAGRPGTEDEIANVAELLMSDKGSFITGADFLIDGGATASFFYEPLKPSTN